MKLAQADHQNLEDNAREFRGLLQHMTNNWTNKEIGFGHDKAEKGKGAVLVRTMVTMRHIIEESLHMTQGRAKFWTQADQCLIELQELRWAGKWKEQDTWLVLRSWNEELQGGES